MKKASQEFEFIRNKLENIASLMCTNNLIEASFMIGCLQNICHENSIKFKEEKDE